MSDFLFPYLGQKPFPGRSPENYDARMRRRDWREEIAPRIRRRAGWVCERCSKQTRFLEVHHLTYEHFGGEPDHDLQALCGECHKKADRERRAADRKWFARNGGCSDGEEEWCAVVFGDDPRYWPDDAAEKFAEWLERKEDRGMVRVVYRY